MYSGKELSGQGRDVFNGDIYPVSGSRILAVMTLAAEKAGWGKSPQPGRGMGMAVCPYGGTATVL